ncbi:phospholipase A [Allopusillimonas ginsengisoli]|uniref:phospholipase A n=1 Tax=Allopusillimonas ginsengisoli TaxID=453575 RepID=UPI00101FE100|nr:phospholipase A [Allopusillimonas ginsengisoli]TEA79789.1 phospholipase [Allopusillimonas ginsengisoli]
MHCSLLSARLTLGVALAVGSLLACDPTYAGISYKLSQTQAAPGDIIKITAVLFNDTDTAMDWTAPKTLVVQWRGPNGQATRSMAYLAEGQGPFTVPVNNFVQISWRATVPSEVQGLQAVNVEGDSTLLALDASQPGQGQVAAAPAIGPVVDAGKAGDTGAPDPALPSGDVIAAGAPLHAGPAPASTPAPVNTASSGFENFRNSLQPYEPVYFAVGNHDGRFARYQISLKYRLFRPQDPSRPDFIDNFYLGYTQTALWDLSSDSSPFVDTSFKPSVFWRKDALWQSQDKQWFAGLQTGIEHESNGKAKDDSRSLNFFYVQPEFNYRLSGGSTLTFSPRVKTYFGVADNPDYADYYGHVDWKLRWAQDNGLVLTGLYRDGDGSRYATQVEAAWPLRRTFINMNGYLYAQYTKGYGDTLLNYNHKTGSQFRIGLALIP